MVRGILVSSALVALTATEAAAMKDWLVVYADADSERAESQVAHARRAMRAMRASSAGRFAAVIFPADAMKLGRSFIEFVGNHREATADGEGLLVVKGSRFFRLLTVNFSPEDRELLALRSDHYPDIPIRALGSMCEEGGYLEPEFLAATSKADAKRLCKGMQLEHGGWMALPSDKFDLSAYDFVPAPVTDLRPALLAFLRSHGFAQLDFRDVSLVLQGGPKKPYTLTGAWPAAFGAKPAKLTITPLLGEECATSVLHELEITRAAATATHLYLETRFTLMHCDWEAGGCGCRAAVGKGELPRLIVLEKGTSKATLIDIDSQFGRAEGRR